MGDANTTTAERDGTFSVRIRMNQFEKNRPLSPVEMWDLFVDELDQRGQAGAAADVVIPSTFQPAAPGGKRFAELTRVEIDALAQLGRRLGRRGDVVKDIWSHIQQTLKSRARAKLKSR